MPDVVLVVEQRRYITLRPEVHPATLLRVSEAEGMGSATARAARTEKRTIVSCRMCVASNRREQCKRQCDQPSFG